MNIGFSHLQKLRVNNYADTNSVLYQNFLSSIWCPLLSFKFLMPTGNQMFRFWQDIGYFDLEENSVGALTAKLAKVWPVRCILPLPEVSNR